MKAEFKRCLELAVQSLQAAGSLPADVRASIQVTRPHDSAHGHFTTNLALQLARHAGCAPRDLAQALIEAMPAVHEACDITTEDPGFINIRAGNGALALCIPEVLEQGVHYGRTNTGNGQSLAILQVPADLSTPEPRRQHQIDGARAVVIGDVVARLLVTIGFEVHMLDYTGEQNSLPADQHLADQRFAKILLISSAEQLWDNSSLRLQLEASNFSPAQIEHLRVKGANAILSLPDLQYEVGRDAARFFMLMRKLHNPVDVSLDLAASRTLENPAYYVQYAHARICSIQRRFRQRGVNFDQLQGLASLDLLEDALEADLMLALLNYPDMLKHAATAREPQNVTRYLRDLANALHTYYNAHSFLIDNDALRNARMCLLLSVKQVLINGLTLVGVSAPEVM